MRKILLPLMTLSVFAMASTDNAKLDLWRQDKQKHFICSGGIAGACTVIARHYGSTEFAAFWAGFGASITIGIMKEFLDGHGNGSEDIDDVYADFLGASTGALISTQFEWQF